MKNIKYFIFTTLLYWLCPLFANAQGWPSEYGGVMLQGFYWDSFTDSRWKVLERRAEELGGYFSLVWVPQSGSCGGGQSMGYDDMWWFNDYNSSFGNEKELRSMIATFKSHGIKTVADVVINHRKNLTSWVDFPRETYKGEVYEMVSTDIVANDDGGATKKWADENGYKLSSAYDTGEDWSGMRDLDHNSANVQRTVHAYLDFLQNDLGYGGFRYDMVKGYAGRFTGLYNSAAKAEFSVGEYWDGNVTAVQNWLNATKVDGQIQSAAFDFPFRYAVRDAIQSNDWRKLDNAVNTLAGKDEYKRYSVTFIENHDTEYRSATEQQDPIRRDTLAGNAFMIAMPGTPCVFLKHWKDYRTDIAKMIRARRLCGVTNESAVTTHTSANGVHAHIVSGKECRLLCAVGYGAKTFTPESGWYLAAQGYHWAYYTDKKIEIGEIVFPEVPFEPYKITVGVDVSEAGWSDVNFWTWGGDGSHTPASGSWPGDRVTSTVTLEGKTYYTKEYTIGSDVDCVDFVFSTGTGKPQTVDIYNVTETTYFAVKKEQSGGKNLVEDVTAEATAVVAPRGSKAAAGGWSTLDGRRVEKPSAKGIYVVDGKKVIIK